MKENKVIIMIEKINIERVVTMQNELTAEMPQKTKLKKRQLQ